MANEKTCFQQLCFSDEFSSWISQLKTKENAFCKVCKRENVLSNMDEGALQAMQMEKKNPDQSDGSWDG